MHWFIGQILHTIYDSRFTIHHLLFKSRIYNWKLVTHYSQQPP